jgi:hypothetical protein
VVYWDEADRIPRIILSRSIAALAASGGRAAIGTHRHLGRRLRHPELTVRTAILGRISAADVLAWAGRRISAVATLDGPGFTLSAEQAATLAAGSGGSWRVIGDDLHAWVARLAGESSGQ